MFSQHPLQWSEIFSATYQVPQEHLAPGVVAGQGRVGDSDTGYAYTQTPTGLYNHVDVIGLLDSLGSEPLHQIGQHYISSLRTVDQGKFPIEVCRDVYNDYRHGDLVKRVTAEGRQPTVQECITEGGTPICDIGAGDGRKVFAHWRKRSKGKHAPETEVYKGPKTLLLDKQPFHEMTGMYTLSPSQGFSLPAGVTTNMVYKQVDLDHSDLDFVPKSFLLVSINSLNQLSPDFLARNIRNRDGIHMIPQVMKLVAEGKATQGDDGRITTRVCTKRGEETYLEYAHSFDYGIFPSTGKSDYYKIAVEFSPRVISCVFNNGVMERYEFTGDGEQRFAEHDARFNAKPQRYMQNKEPLLAPFKLKFDGRTMLISVTADTIKFETSERRITIETEPDHVSTIPVEMQCEYMDRAEDVLVVPHTVYLGGRRLIGPIVAKFMANTVFKIPGFTFDVPTYYNTLDAAVRGMCESAEHFRADGVIALGGGCDVAAKIHESVDIRICDTTVVAAINNANAPRNTEWHFKTAGETLGQPIGCRKHVKSAEEGPIQCRTYGDPDHENCPVREFMVKDRTHCVQMIELRTREDKKLPNRLKRVRQTMPQAKDENNANFPSLLSMLADDQKTALKMAGYDM